MNNLNSIIIEGNLTRDPNLGRTPKGTSVCTFSVASNRYMKLEGGVQKEVSFFDVETWAKLAEACGENLLKGRGVRVVGRLKQDRWQDLQGVNHSKIKIVAEHVEFKPVFKDKDSAVEDSDDAVTEDAAAEDVNAADIEEVQEVVNF